MSTFKSVMTAVVVFLALNLATKGILTYMNRNDTPETKSLSQMTKKDYVDEAVKNCAVDENSESFCRCFYVGLLNNYSIDEVYEFDLQASLNADYQYTEEQINIAARCI